MTPALPGIVARHRAVPRWPALLAGLALAIACSPTHDLPLPEGAYVIEDRGLSEMSGLEASPTQPGVLWSVNDSGSIPRLFRLGMQGQDLGRVRLRGAWVRDAETLAVWREGETTWLLIGDVGDNRGLRSQVAVHAVAEPGPNDTEARVAWSITFSYPGGPRDAEGIAVDHRSGDILVLTKREAAPRLYRVPLSARDAAAPVVAELLAQLPANSLDGEVTGLDLTKDGTRLAVLSYRGLYVWSRHADEPWSDVLARMPQSLDLPRMRKAEAMAFDASGESILVGSERLPAPLLSIALNGG